jgi:hypothetical protein
LRGERENGPELDGTNDHKADLIGHMIAREVGYEDAASFRRLFRRLAGMTPGDYRRKFQLPSLVTRAAANPRPRRKAQGTAHDGVDGGRTVRVRP